MREKWTEPVTCPRIPASLPPRHLLVMFWSLIIQNTPPNLVRITAQTLCISAESTTNDRFQGLSGFLFWHRSIWRVHPWSAFARPPERGLWSVLEPKPQWLFAQCFWWPCKKQLSLIKPIQWNYSNLQLLTIFAFSHRQSAFGTLAQFPRRERSWMPRPFSQAILPLWRMFPGTFSMSPSLDQ